MMRKLLLLLFLAPAIAGAQGIYRMDGARLNLLLPKDSSSVVVQHSLKSKMMKTDTLLVDTVNVRDGSYIVISGRTWLDEYLVVKDSIAIVNESDTPVGHIYSLNDTIFFRPYISGVYEFGYTGGNNLSQIEARNDTVKAFTGNGFLVEDFNDEGSGRVFLATKESLYVYVPISFRGGHGRLQVTLAGDVTDWPDSSGEFSRTAHEHTLGGGTLPFSTEAWEEGDAPIFDAGAGEFVPLATVADSGSANTYRRGNSSNDAIVDGSLADTTIGGQVKIKTRGTAVLKGDGRELRVDADSLDGVVPVANLGSGTPTATTSLKGDGSWKGDTLYFVVALSDESSDQTAGTAKKFFPLPRNVTPVRVELYCSTAPTDDSLEVDIHVFSNAMADGGSIFDDEGALNGDYPTIDPGEYSSLTSAVTWAVLGDPLDHGQFLRFDFEDVGDTVSGKGITCVVVCIATAP